MSSTDCLGWHGLRWLGVPALCCPCSCRAAHSLTAGPCRRHALLTPGGAGKERQERGNFVCLVADSQHSSSPASTSTSAGGSTSSSGAARGRRRNTSAGGVAWNESAAAGGRRSPVGSPEAALGMVPAGVRVDLGPLADFLVSLALPPSMQQNYASTYVAGGLRGALVLDTHGEHLPPKQARTPSGFIR